jgi:GMP synthase-like glutamine amidotransferase
MKIHSIHHAPFEGLGCIENWITSKRFPLSSTNIYKFDNLPDTVSFDLLIIMGGPMGVYDEERFSWLKDEKNLIKKSIEENKIVLGICLGSQLIADVLGAKVYPNKFKEIGWFPVNFTSSEQNNFLFSSFPKKLNVFHWHGNTFNLPKGALHIAENSVCRNQAFTFNERVIGLQFHLEMTETAIKEMLKEGDLPAGKAGNELIEDKYIQSAEEILRLSSQANLCNVLLYDLLNKIEKRFKGY